jgi:hypothetical protein
MMTVPWVAPDACTLPTAEQPLRVAEFDDLFGRYLVRVERPEATRGVLVLSGPEGLQVTVRELADREASCCSFFGFTVTQLPAGESGTVGVRLDVEVPPARVEVLSALLERAESARGGDRHVG